MDDCPGRTTLRDKGTGISKTLEGLKGLSTNLGPDLDTWSRGELQPRGLIAVTLLHPLSLIWARKIALCPRMAATACRIGTYGRIILLQI